MSTPNPTLEQDVTAWQAITKAEHTITTLMQLGGIDPSMEDGLKNALKNLGGAKMSINIRRAQRINEAGAMCGKQIIEAHTCTPSRLK